MDDDELPDGRTSGGTIGVESAPYGQATVDVFDDERRVATASTDERNHVWVEGLEPDHEYRYRVTVDGADWGGGEQMGLAARPGRRRFGTVGAAVRPATAYPPARR